jgi:hypothetical protein
MNTVATKPDLPTAKIVEDVLTRGDLKDLTPEQRSFYYIEVCNSLGINWRTRPFEYLTLNGRLVLYAKRDAADQLRRIHGISVEIVGRELVDGLLIVTAHAKDKDGRSDEDYGVVAFKGGASEIAANLMMKAVTKAKRRVTLSISGLGFLDETEVSPPAGKPKLISKTQRQELRDLAEKVEARMPDYLDHLSERWDMEISKVGDIPISHFDDAMALLRLKEDAMAKVQNQFAGAGGGDAEGMVEPSSAEGSELAHDQ